MQYQTIIYRQVIISGDISINDYYVKKIRYGTKWYIEDKLDDIIFYHVLLFVTS